MQQLKAELRMKKHKKYTYLPYDSDESFELVSPSQVSPDVFHKFHHPKSVEVKEESEDDSEGCKYCRKKMPKLEKLITQLLLEKFEGPEASPMGADKISKIHFLKNEEKDYYLIEFMNDTCEAINKQKMPREHVAKVAGYMENMLWD